MPYKALSEAFARLIPFDVSETEARVSGIENGVASIETFYDAAKWRHPCVCGHGGLDHHRGPQWVACLLCVCEVFQLPPLPADHEPKWWFEHQQVLLIDYPDLCV